MISLPSITFGYGSLHDSREELGLVGHSTRQLAPSTGCGSLLEELDKEVPSSLQWSVGLSEKSYDDGGE
jgi:hypothetical protein